LQDIISNSAELRTVLHLHAAVLKFVNLYVLDFSHSLSPILTASAFCSANKRGDGGSCYKLPRGLVVLQGACGLTVVHVFTFLNCVTVCQLYRLTLGPGYLSRNSDSLRGGQSGDRIPVGERFSTPIQTGPRAHPTSYTMSTGSFPGVKQPGRGVDHPPPSSAEVKERVEL
jgi:hypothetical protein